MCLSYVESRDIQGLPEDSLQVTLRLHNIQE